MNAEAENNKAAAEILSQMLDKGEIMQNPDGSVEVIREDAVSQPSNIGEEMIWSVINSTVSFFNVLLSLMSTLISTSNLAILLKIKLLLLVSI